MLNPPLTLTILVISKMAGKHRNAHQAGGAELLKGLGRMNGFLKWFFFGARAMYIWGENLEANKALRSGEVSGKLEDARLGTLEDLDKLGMLDGNGWLLGQFDGHNVCLPHDYHLCCQGVAGMGKTSSFTIPNIIKAMTDDPGESLVVLDWKKKELTRATATSVAALNAEGSYVFEPFDLLNAVFINIFQDLIDGAARGEPMVDEARARLRVFFADSLEKAGQNEWIVKAAFAVAVLLAVARAHLDPKALTAGGFYDFAGASYEDVMDLMAVLSEHDEVAGGFVAAGARTFMSRYPDPSDLREYRWMMESLGEAFTLFAPGSALRRATEKTNVDIASFRKKRQALDVVIPDRYLFSAAPFVSAVLDYVVETAAHAEGSLRLGVLAEEFAALPFNENVLKCVRTYRSLGIRFVSVVQDRTGFSRYKKHGSHRPFEDNAVRLYFGLSDPDHLQQLERRAGKKAVLLETHSTSMGPKVPCRARGGTETLTPVLPASEIAKIGVGKALLDIPGQPLFILGRAPWWEMPEIAPYVRDTRFDA